MTENEWILVKNILNSFAFIIGIIGNVIVILAISVNKGLRSTTHIYLLNLSISDFIYLLSIPFTIITSIKQDWIFNTFICKVFWLLQGVNQFTSVAFVSVLSVDRYFKKISKFSIRISTQFYFI